MIMFVCEYVKIRKRAAERRAAEKTGILIHMKAQSVSGNRGSTSRNSFGWINMMQGYGIEDIM